LPFGRDKFDALLCPRPGHVDLAGMLKYGFDDLRNVWERSSARSTAILVAFGALAKQFLKKFGIHFFSFTVRIGEVGISPIKSLNVSWIKKSLLRCPDREAERKMLTEIGKAQKDGDSLGGVFGIVVENVPVGLGTYTDFSSKLDARIAHALVSIPSIKGIEFGLGFDYAYQHGSEVHDEIFYSPKRGFYRKTNNAGGIEGGVSNGEDIVLKCVVKPIPSLKVPLRSVDIKSKKAKRSCVLRSDVCVVPSAALIGENMCALVILDAFLEKFGNDSFLEIKTSFSEYTKKIRNL